MMESNFSAVLSVVKGFLDHYDGNMLPNPIPDPFPDVGFGVPSSSDFNRPHNFDTDLPSDWTQTQDQYSPSSGDEDLANPLLNYVSQILMEESIEDQPSMFYDSLALQRTEEMLQRVIRDSSQVQSASPYNSIASMDSGVLWIDNLDSSVASVSFDSGASSDTVVVTDPPGVSSGFNPNVALPGSNRLTGSSDGSIGPSVNELLVRSMFSDVESIMQFKKGLEEAKKFLPNSDQLIIHQETEKSFPDWDEEADPGMVRVKVETGLDSPPDPLRVRKNREGNELDLEESRSRKQSATNVEDENVTEMFDKVLLLDAKLDPQTIIESGKTADGSSGQGKAQAKKEGRKKKRNETVDFHTRLLLCAQAISTGDKGTAHDLLRQIKQHSSPLGDASQRLAHCFANGLEARLKGSTGPVIQSYYDSLASKKTTAADILKAYKVYLSACPFKTLIYFFSNKMIVDIAKDAPVLHIVDFGILYGFQWPMFIQYIANRKCGPSKLRITGIELPQPGFRPAERIHETGRRLAEYCDRFGVPFEYNAIASNNWDTIRIEDLKLRPDEVLAVNCGMRFKNLQDETAGEDNCPRDVVLRLIRSMNPYIFTHSIINGSFNAPFFTTRFKETLFHYSALFDMFDSTLPRESRERLRFEREFYGREAMNVIACEGAERVERPETYKQWQVRMGRAGFRQKPVETKMVECFRGKLKRWGYHKDFVVDEGNNWFLQGWKGRILYASSCWVPA
ncbi:PREDICTED: scarecrow-like protein 34 [Tarenaya hassleriana]|uniref:scarecrow-like protein 34 n=1 Tax=Tarenaya hassleriana TaxID=28532 RepID=UPI00053C3AF4|nr:PREDICTED: scarecrow-like protein 34 [Tarenaya hassleriana]